MVKLHFLDPLHHTIFENQAFLDRAGILSVASAQEADGLATRWFRDLTPEIMGLGKPVIVWTHEPWFTIEQGPLVRNHLGGRDVFVFSCWNRNVYTDNYYYGPRPSRRVEFIEDTPEERARFDLRRVAHFGRCSAKTLIRDGVDHSLYPKRAELALGLHKLGLCDVYGRDWPEGVAMGESRHNDRVKAKISGLANYPFCIAAENSTPEFYVTEKIWEAIQGRSLPIYWPNPGLAGVLPGGSIINPYDHLTIEGVAALIQDMRFEEWRERMNALISWHEVARDAKLFAASRARSADNVIAILGAL